MDRTQIDTVATQLVEGGRRFAETALAGLADRGVDTGDPAALMLAIRRLGAKRMEAFWGQGAQTQARRAPLVPADWAEELDEMAADWVARARQDGGPLAPLRVTIGTTDVHEHGAYLVSRALDGLEAEVLDAGVALDAEVLVDRAV